jgi:hypothetical protein
MASCHIAQLSKHRINFTLPLLSGQIRTSQITIDWTSVPLGCGLDEGALNLGWLNL